MRKVLVSYVAFFCFMFVIACGEGGSANCSSNVNPNMPYVIDHGNTKQEYGVTNGNSVSHPCGSTVLQQ